MPAMNRFTEEQLRAFADQGYAMIGRIMDDATLEVFRVDEGHCREDLLRSAPSAMNLLTLVMPQAERYPGIVEFAKGGPHRALLEQIIGPSLVLWRMQLVTKLQDSASGKSYFPWHQDNGYDPALAHATSSVSVWLALDDVDEENGCLWILPGSHKGGLAPHERIEGGWHPVQRAHAEGDGMPIRLKAGEAVAFSGFMLHRSKHNHTPRARRGFFMNHVDPVHVQKDGSSDHVQQNRQA